VSARADTAPARIANPWGDRTPYGRGDSWPERVDLQLADGVGPEDVERWAQSASVLHSNGDALDIAVRDGAIVGVRGRAAAPEPWAELSPADADELGISDGDLVAIETARGTIEVPARVNGIRPGVVFVPFHYGYWDLGDDAGPDGRPAGAANELTQSAWDPVSKQPLYKVAAARVTRVGERS
jgi:predicted molibdopterin-dependent oxidoreductase YjgC